jgi:hypothetical protein
MTTPAPAAPAAPSADPVQSLGFMQGVDVSKASNFKVASGFSWRDAPYSPILGYLFPGETTYHTLMNASDYELASNLFSISGSNMRDDEKKIYTDKMREIVVDNPYLNYVCTKNMIIIVLLIIAALIFFGSNQLDPNTTNILLFLIGGIIFLQSIALLGEGFMKSQGEARWNDFTTMINAKLASGKSATALLQEINDKDDIRKMELKYAQSGMGSNISTQGTNMEIITGVAIGSMIGNMMRR